MENDWGGEGLIKKALPTHGVRKTIRREKQRKNEKTISYTSDIEIKTQRERGRERERERERMCKRVILMSGVR